VRLRNAIVSVKDECERTRHFGSVCEIAFSSATPASSRRWPVRQCSAEAATQRDATKPFGGACGRSTVVGGNDIFAWYCNLWRESKVRKTGISAFCCTRPDTDRVIATR
jgi:hypothetical protein